MNRAKLIAGLIIVALIVIVFLQNLQPVQFTFLFFGDVLVSKTILIFASALFGSAVTLIAQLVIRSRRRRPPAGPIAPPAPNATAAPH